MLKKSIVFTALAGLAFTVNIPAPADAGVCINHRHTGSARAPLKSTAEIAARAKWRFEVIKHGHPSRILWSQAKNKSMSCSKKVYGYKCWAKATPCDAHTTIPGKGGYKETRNVLGRCLDVAGGVNANRTNVQIFDCNGTKSQKWHYVTSNKTIRSNTGGRCLDVAGGVNANRTNVQIFDCNGTKSQQWTRTGRKEFRNAMGRCLEVAGGVNANGTNVQIFDCNRTKSQQWTQ